MSSTNGLISTCAVVFVLASFGCTTSTIAPVGSSPPLSRKIPREVPRLKVVVDCNCAVKTNVPDLIVQGYTEEAADSGTKIAPELEATLTIKEYSARDDTARLLLGVFSGKDEIKAVVTFGDKRFLIEDYFRNAVSGTDTLARKIGRMAFEKISQ